MVAISYPTASRTPRLSRPRPAVTAATYRRRRLVAAALLAFLLVSLAVTSARIAGIGGEGAALSTRSVVEVSVVVEPGDTVWSIARSLHPAGDVRPVVDALIAANGGATLEAGDRLVVSLP